MKHEKNQRVQSSKSENTPDAKMIERRAYELYLERGGEHGHDSEDWLQAEREVKQNGQAAGVIAGG